MRISGDQFPRGLRASNPIDRRKIYMRDRSLDGIAADFSFTETSLRVSAESAKLKVIARKCIEDPIS